MENLRKVVEAAVVATFGIEIKVELSRTDEQFGDFATNVALQLSKQIGKNPREVADLLVLSIEDDSIAKLDIAGPGFINITLHGSALALWLSESLKVSPNNVFGASDVGHGRTVLCEFPSPNMAKPYSVGHLRSATQGWSLYKLLKLSGYSTVTDNHLGDYGTPFGKWVVGFLRHSSADKLKKGGVYELGRLYVEVTKELKAEKEAGLKVLADDVQLWLQKLAASDPEAVSYAELFRSISLSHMHTVLDRLKISTENELGESFYVERGQAMVDELLQKGIAEKSEGAVVVRLDSEGIDVPIVIRKANGSALYATTDMATIEYRQKTWDPERVFIHVGQEQAFYFRQLKALARKIGLKDNIVHVWHGIVDQKNIDGTREKMSSRKGVILLEDLINKAEEVAQSKMKEGSEADARKVALGAVKFQDFTADRKKGMLFEWEGMFSTQGFSGPSVQYAAVRIGSILAKAGGVEDVSLTNYNWDAEHPLLLKTLYFPTLIMEMQETYELHPLATYLYDLARELNRYYDQTPVLKSDPEVRNARLWLLAAVRQVLSTGLDVLGIEVPEKM